MKRIRVRPARRLFAIVVSCAAVGGLAITTNPVMGQNPSQPPSQRPTKPRVRSSTAKPAAQPPQTDEEKNAPDAAAVAPKEAAEEQPQTPPNPPSAQPQNPMPGSEGDQPAPNPTDAAAIEAALQGAGAQPQTPPAETPKRPDEMDPAKRVEEARKAAADRAAARRARNQPSSQGQQGTGTTGSPSSTTFPQPSLEQAGELPTEGGPTTPINIAPEESDVPPEARTYSFSIKDGTYEQLIEGFARQTGMGVIGDAPKDGKVTFVTTETMTFDQALARVRILLFNYKPLEPYWMLRNETNLQVIKVNDFYRILPRDRMFRSVEEFRAANLSNDELALVVYTPKTGSVSDLRQVRDWLPDYVRVTPLEDQNSVTIFALVSDIEKYLDLMQWISGTRVEPRTLTKIEVHHLLASEALNRLRQLMDIEGGAPQGKVAQAASRRPAREPSAIDTLPEPPVTVIPDDAQGILLVRAMQDKIDEIKLLLPYIDVDMSTQAQAPVIIKLQYADAGEMISTLQTIFSASSAQPGAAVPPRPKKGRKVPAGPAAPVTPAVTGAGAAVSPESVTMLVHPSDNAIIVLADEEGVARVRELVTLFDVSTKMEPVRLPLAHSDATEALNTINAVLGTANPKGKPITERFNLVADPAGDALWFSGDDKDLDRVKGLMVIIDVATEPVSLHVVTMVYQTPTFVSNMLREFDGSVPSSPAPAAAGKKPKTRRAVSVPTSKFTPDEASKKMFILCTEDEWARYQPLIAQLDRPADDGDVFVRLPLQYADPNTAIERLTAMLGDGPPGEESIRFLASEQSILVLGAKPHQIERIKVFLAEVDKPSRIEQRTFEIRYANPSDIQSAIESLIANAPSKAPVRKARKADAGKISPPGDATVSDQLTVVQLGQRLVVQTTPARMEQVAALIAEFDVEESKTELKVYSDFPPGTNIEAISDTVSSVFINMGRGSTKRVKEGAAADGPKFIPQPASGRLVVIAEPTLFPEIERLLTVLRHEVESRPTVVAMVEVKFVNPDELVESIKPLLDIKIRGLVESGELEEGGEEGAAPVKSSKRRPTTAQTSGERYHLSPDSRNSRVVIAAPQVVVDQAKALIAQFDTPGEKPVFKTVELANASPDEMVRAVKEMMGRPSPRKAPGKGKTPATPAMELGSGGELAVVEAPGGGAVILHGQAAEVAQAENWIKQMDAMSTRGRSIKVYEIKKADMTKLFDLIVNVVGASGPAAGKAPRSPRGGKGDSKDEDIDEEFTTSKTYTSADLYIQADLISKTMLVAATPSKIAEIDDLVARVDKGADEEKGISMVMGETPSVPKLTYDLKFAEASDAKWDLQDALKMVWEPSDELPQVDGFGKVLIVRYPHENRFEEIRDLIRAHADKPDPEKTKVIKRSIPAPEGLNAKVMAALLKMNLPEFDVELQDITPRQDTHYNIEQIRPSKHKKPSPCVLPGAFHRTTEALLGSIVGASQPQPEEPEPDEEEATEDEPEEEFVPAPTGDEMIRQAVTPMLPGKAAKKVAEPDAEDKPKASEKSGEKLGEKSPPKRGPKGEKLIIHYDENADVVVIEGQAGDLEDLDDWIKDIKDEFEGFPVKPDIRIFRPRYIDVFTAQDILEEMFNATRQQQAAFQQQQQQMMRQQQLQQQQQQRQQQGARGQQQGEQPGGPGSQGGRAGQQQPQMPQLAQAQLPQAGVRIYPNPRDRTLIIRAETSQYPQIEELLATIDQPKPIDSEMRTWPLKNLNAGEVEEILREIIGIGKESARPRAARAQAQPGAAGPSAPSGGPGESLPRTILQKTISGLSELNVDPDDIKLFSSEVSNTVMAVAPRAALDFIGELINKLESEDVPQRITKYYEFKHADVEDAADYLESHFAEISGARKSQKRGGEGAAAGGGGKPLNAPSFVPYPRLNWLTVQATAVQIEEIDQIVARIDVSGGTDKWEDVALAHADAKLVADTLTKMFGEKAGGASGSGKATIRGAAVPKFIGEEGGGIVFFSAPPSLRDQILTNIAKLEEQYKETRTPRIIELKNAKASALAEAIEKAYDAKKSGSKSGGSTPSRFTITAHDPTRRLFVIADDETFKEVEALAKLLDDKPGGIGVEFRIYPLQYASAKAVHAQMTKLLKDYLGRLGQDANKIEAFSVEPDEVSNSLIVLGGPTVFGFLEENIRKVDTPGMKVTMPASLIVPMTNTVATEVAANIKAIYAAKEQPLGMTPPQVEANPATNALIVRGTQAQIEEIKRDIIDPLEAQVLKDRMGQHHTFKLKFADPGGVTDAITKLFRTDSRQARDQVLAVTEYTSNSVIVSASPENLKRVEALIAEIDNAETSQQDVHVVEIKHADAQSVAQTLTEIFVRAGTKQVGNQAPPITISAMSGSRALLIKCKAEDFARIMETIKELDTEDVGTGGEVRVVTLLYGDANEIGQALEKYLTNTGGTGRGPRLMGDARISVMAQSNSIMISAAKEEVERLIEIAKGMDIAGEKGSVPQIIPLKYANVGLILPSVQEIFSETRGGGGRRNQPAPIIVADESSNALIVRASPTDLTAIQGIVAQLDTVEKQDKTPFVIIKVATGINVTDLAEQVETTLNETAQAQAGTGRGVRVPSVTITPNLRTNSLLVSGSSAMFGQAEALVRKLEEMGPAGDRVTAIVPLKRTKVDEVQKLIDQLTQQPGEDSRRGGGRSGSSNRQRSRP